jgi:hypothetical protein
MPAETIVYSVNEKVDVSGGSKRWYAGTVTRVEEAHYIVRLEKPMLGSTWEGRPRKFDGTITEVKIHRSGFEKNSIRKRA